MEIQDVIQKIKTGELGGVIFAGDTAQEEVFEIAETGTEIEEREVEQVLLRLAELNHARKVARLINELCADAEKFLISRYESQVKEFALRNLPKGKKSVSLGTGDLAFRSAKAKVQIGDHAVAASLLANITDPDNPDRTIADRSVELEPRVYITRIPTGVLASIEKRLEPGDTPPDATLAQGFKYTPATESFTIKPAEVEIV